MVEVEVEVEMERAAAEPRRAPSAPERCHERDTAEQ